ncbi:hypothetical protein ACFE04_017472 [Oxalis oulophora]
MSDGSPRDRVARMSIGSPLDRVARTSSGSPRDRFARGGEGSPRERAAPYNTSSPRSAVQPAMVQKNRSEERESSRASSERKGKGKSKVVEPLNLETAFNAAAFYPSPSIEFPRKQYAGPVRALVVKER